MGLMVHNHLIIKIDLSGLIGNHATQALPWGQMQTEIGNKAILLSLANLSNQAACRSTAATSFKGGNLKICFAFNSAKGCFRGACRFHHVCSFCYRKHPRANCYIMLNQSHPHTSPFSQAPQSGATPSQNITARSNQGLRIDVCHSSSPSAIL